MELKKKERISQEIKKEVEKKLTFINRIRPFKGHIVYKYSYSDNELSLCEFEKSSKEITWEKAIKKDYSQNKKVIVDEGCIYFNALNFRNAKKILKRDYGLSDLIIATIKGIF